LREIRTPGARSRRRGYKGPSYPGQNVRPYTPDKFPFQQGDIVVIQPTKHGNPAGHIAGYDGKDWISDFVQRGFWPGSAYEKEKPGYVVYRR
jgi:hypothetical protein